MTLTMDRVKVRIHITEGQRAALLAILRDVPTGALLTVRGYTATFEMQDPGGWLEARMAEWPRGEFPRASLHGVLRSLHSAIQSQVEPDLHPSQGQPDSGSPEGS